MCACGEFPIRDEYSGHVIDEATIEAQTNSSAKLNSLREILNRPLRCAACNMRTLQAMSHLTAWSSTLGLENYRACVGRPARSIGDTD